MTPAKRAQNKRRRKRKREEKKAELLANMEAAIAHLPKPTDHARERWAERFREDETFSAAYARSVTVTYAALRISAAELGLGLRLRPTSEFRHDSLTGALFVIDSDGGPTGGKELRTIVRLRIPVNPVEDNQ
jgi:hypothetical protein